MYHRDTDMKNIITLFVVSVFVFATGYNTMKAETIKHIPTRNKTVIIDFPVHGSALTKFSIEIFPTEIYWGDTVYLAVYQENISPEVVKICGSNNDIHEYYWGDFIFSSDMLHMEYKWIPEHPSGKQSKRAVPIQDLQPGAKYVDQMNYLEFPPLEDLEEPFWKELSANLPKEGITCKLHIKHGYYNPSSNEAHEMEVERDILIRPRPASEMALLEKWYKNTPEKLFPRVEGKRKVPYNMGLRSSGRSNIWIGWHKYDPWMFVRTGNRKPSEPNNPTMLTGWRQLEASLVPSTMRDEVRLVRLQLEYYAAKAGTNTEKAKRELVDWLESLPKVQRGIMTAFLASTMNDFGHSDDYIMFLIPLRDKNRALIRATYDMLEPGSQEYAYRQDNSLPLPKDWVPPAPSILDVMIPTPQELEAHRLGKESDNGFRVWTMILPDGKENLFFGKFLFIKNKSGAYFQSRDGRVFIKTLEYFSQDDLHIMNKLVIPLEIPDIDYREWTGTAKGLPVTAIYVDNYAGAYRVKTKGDGEEVLLDFYLLSPKDQDYIQRLQSDPRYFLERSWHSDDNKFLFYGRFLSITDEKVTIQKRHGEAITLKFSEISELDREYISLAQQTAQIDFSLMSDVSLLTRLLSSENVVDVPSAVEIPQASHALYYAIVVVILLFAILLSVFILICIRRHYGNQQDSYDESI
jgi:hypothetical protein